MSKNSNKIIDDIEAAIHRCDPVHIIYEPSRQLNEYSYEAEGIFKRINAGEDLTLELVHSVFVEAFNENVAGPKEIYEETLKEIKKALNI